MEEEVERDDDGLLKDDYYSLLNVSKEASKTDIDRAYRQLCRIYHPDKHQGDNKKKNAEILFNKLKRAHEVLSDEHKRIVYDLYGEKGLETYQMEIVSRNKTPAEIYAEYEKYKEEREKRLLQRFKDGMQAGLTINATDIFEPYNPYDEDVYDSVERIPNVETRSMSLSNSVSYRLTTQDTCVLTGSISSANGNGSYKLVAVWERLLPYQSKFTVGPMIGDKSGFLFNFSKDLFRKCLTFKVNTKMIYAGTGVWIPIADTSLEYRFDNYWKGSITWNIVNTSSVMSSISYKSDLQDATISYKLGLRDRYLSTSYTRNFLEHNISATVCLKVGTMRHVPLGFELDYGIEKETTDHCRLGASVCVGYPSGVKVRIKSGRGNHSFLLPIHLSDEILPSSVVYGTFIPILAYYAVKKLIVDPFILRQKEKELEKKKQEQREAIQQRKKEAQALVELMEETVNRIIQNEENVRGLIIISALYGRLSSGQTQDLQREDCIDVTVPVQALVQDSKIVTPENTTKCSIPGFYDPCLGEEKSLYIKYKFRNQLHHTTVKDEEKIRIPLSRHQMNNHPHSPTDAGDCCHR